MVSPISQSHRPQGLVRKITLHTLIERITQASAGGEISAFIEQNEFSDNQDYMLSV